MSGEYFWAPRRRPSKSILVTTWWRSPTKSAAQYGEALATPEFTLAGSPPSVFPSSLLLCQPEKRFSITAAAAATRWRASASVPQSVQGIVQTTRKSDTAASTTKLHYSRDIIDPNFLSQYDLQLYRQTPHSHHQQKRGEKHNGFGNLAEGASETQPVSSKPAPSERHRVLKYIRLRIASRRGQNVGKRRRGERRADRRNQNKKTDKW